MPLAILAGMGLPTRFRSTPWRRSCFVRGALPRTIRGPGPCTDRHVPKCGTGDGHIGRGTGGLTSRSHSSVPILTPWGGYSFLWENHHPLRVAIFQKSTIAILKLFLYGACPKSETSQNLLFFSAHRLSEAVHTCKVAFSEQLTTSDWGGPRHSGVNCAQKRTSCGPTHARHDLAVLVGQMTIMLANHFQGY